MTNFIKNIHDKHDRDESGHIKSYLYLDGEEDLTSHDHN